LLGGALLRVGPAEVIDSTREDRINSFVKRLSTPFFALKMSL
jgi:hypothetical protein